MSKYNGTFSCGHDGVVEVFGPTKSREWIADRKFENLCSDCYEEKKIQDRKDALASAVEQDLPTLTGTKKQINWAIVIRQNLIDIWENQYKQSTEEKDIEYNKRMASILEYILYRYTAAEFYIDNFRYSFNISYLLTKYGAEYDKQQELAAISPNEKDIAEITAEITLYPEKQKHKVPVEIKINDNIIKAISPKNEKFKDLVKYELFGWSQDERCWMRKIRTINGTPSDRAAELANKLLSAGFAVIASDAEVREKAISAAFEPEHFKWIEKLKISYVPEHIKDKYY